MNDIITDQYKKAAELNQRIIFTAQMAQKNLYDMCVLLKEMRDDKLYKELGYNNFEDYCENEVGMNRRNAYRYIAVIENIKNVTSMTQIGMTKLSLLASLSESQQEEIQEKVNVENVSVRDLKEEIKKLKEDKEAAEKKAQDEITNRIHLQSDVLSLKSKNRSLSHELEEAKHNGGEHLKEQLDRAQQEIQDLKKSMSADQKTQDALIRQLDAQLSNADQEHANETNRLRQQYQQKINELQEKLDNAAYTEVAVETVTVKDYEMVVKAYENVVISAFSHLCAAVSNADEHSQIELRRRPDKLLEGLKKQWESVK